MGTKNGYSTYLVKKFDFVFFSHRNLFESLQNLQTLEQKVDTMVAQGNTAGQYKEALHLAAEFPFRTQAVKLVLWLTPPQQQVTHSLVLLIHLKLTSAIQCICLQRILCSHTT